ncbi:MAG TPA: RIP metalloprotease RseP [Parafilimonas sp.]|nr:RIP metalloprotease RseP [Parafilimonas sp.]
MTLLAIDWAGIGIKTLQLIFSLSILVTIHELGHYATAKWFKCRVEKFYLFFDPWFSIWKKKIGETVYGIGWVPFGGYVKISGMIDESMDKEQMKQPPKSYEFRSKPAWQRLIIMVAGVIMNVLLALFLYIMITFKWGEEYIPPQHLKYGLHADSLAKKIGLQDGDNIISIDNVPLKDASIASAEIITSDAKNLQVQRNGQLVNVPIPDGFISQLMHTRGAGFTSVRFPVIVDSVDSKSVTIVKGSLQKDDQIIAFNGQQVPFYYQFENLKKPFADKDVDLTLLRGNDTVTTRVKLNSKSQVGFQPKFPDKLFGTAHKTYSFAESIPVGISRCFTMLDKNITGLGQIITGKVKASESLGSVISIGSLFPGLWDWQSFWSLTALLSIILAFMNILPIPALDGGHALFCIYEMITGRKPSDKFMEYAQLVGMILLLALMAYALGLDIFRLFK